MADEITPVTDPITTNTEVEGAASDAPRRTLLSDDAEAAATGEGNDSASGAEGTDSQPAGEGNDTLEGAEGNDSIAGAPETYADFNTPDGIELDGEVLDQFRGVAKELNLPQDKAQGLVDLAVQLSQKWGADLASQVEANITEWGKQTQADPEIGGANLKANLAIARKARDAFGSPALQELLDTSGLGNHPEVVRFFVKVGQGISEDKLVVRDGDTSPKPKGQADLAKAFYPNME